MKKKEYKTLLLDSKWKIKRMVILKRDNFCCVKCTSKQELQIHHKYYIKDRLPWQYSNSALITLCKVCHQKEHDQNKIEVKKKQSNKPNIKAESKKANVNPVILANQKRKARLEKAFPTPLHTIGKKPVRV